MLDAAVAEDIHDLARTRTTLGEQLAESLAKAMKSVARRDTGGACPLLHPHPERFDTEWLPPLRNNDCFTTARSRVESVNQFPVQRNPNEFTGLLLHNA